MSLTQSIQRFVEANEIHKKRLEPNTREFVLISCRIMYARNLLVALMAPPTPEEDIIHVRSEFHKMISNREFVGQGHQFLVEEFDKGNELIF